VYRSQSASVASLTRPVSAVTHAWQQQRQNEMRHQLQQHTGWLQQFESRIAQAQRRAGMSSLVSNNKTSSHQSSEAQNDKENQIDHRQVNSSPSLTLNAKPIEQGNNHATASASASLPNEFVIRIKLQHNCKNGNESSLTQ
jgi:hypothetical protein